MEAPRITCSLFSIFYSKMTPITPESAQVAMFEDIIIDTPSFKGLSYSYFNVFGILIFFYVLPLHLYIPKKHNGCI